MKLTTFKRPLKYNVMPLERGAGEFLGDVNIRATYKRKLYIKRKEGRLKSPKGYAPSWFEAYRTRVYFQK